MLDGIQETIDSYFPEDFTFYQMRATQFVKEAALETIPFVLVAGAILSCAKVIFSRSLYDYVTKENTVEMAEKIFDSMYKFSKDFPEKEKSKTALVVKKYYQERLDARLEQIDLLSKKMDIKDISLAVDFDSDMLYEAVGDRNLTKNPLIVIGMNSENKIELSTPLSEIPNPPELKKVADVILAHEMTHIQKCDYSTKILAQTIMAVVNTYLWFTPYGLLSKALFAFGMQCVFKAIALPYIRYQEARADKNALDTLKTNEGAILFFSSLQNNPKDLSHPSITDRLLAAKNWKAS